MLKFPSQFSLKYNNDWKEIAGSLQKSYRMSKIFLYKVILKWRKTYLKYPESFEFVKLQKKNGKRKKYMQNIGHLHGMWHSDPFISELIKREKCWFEGIFE